MKATSLVQNNVYCMKIHSWIQRACTSTYVIHAHQDVRYMHIMIKMHDHDQDTGYMHTKIGSLCEVQLKIGKVRPCHRCLAGRKQ